MCDACEKAQELYGAGSDVAEYVRMLTHPQHWKPEPTSREREISWAEFCSWVSARKVLAQREEYGGEIHIEFEDGSRAVVRSNYDGPYSDVTPGNGIEPPTVTVTEAR